MCTYHRVIYANLAIRVTALHVIYEHTNVPGSSERTSTPFSPPLNNVRVGEDGDGGWRHKITIVMTKICIPISEVVHTMDNI